MYVETTGIFIPAIIIRVVEVLDAVMTLMDHIVICDHHTGDGAQEDRVSRKVCREVVATFEQIPRAHAKPNDGRDVSTTPDILE